ncbi:hypothetical protein QAD02_000833 [Eretmocerus hayati]|uniref:Uncharacterized protein n=1 Tax=Eretmocerus hayati TaxID=131215 RepID=A0ACC2NGW1_9HYME|nr:hypothetical protein QAD02_000833 [Eretmocerus hayati]
MWTLPAFVIIVMAVSNINMNQATRNNVYQIIRHVNPQDRLFFSKDPSKNGRKKFPFAVCGLIDDSIHGDIYCDILASSLDSAEENRWCGNYTYIKSLGGKFWDSNMKFDVGALTDFNKTIVSFEVSEYDIMKRKVVIWDTTTCKNKTLEFSYEYDESDPPPFRSYIIMDRNKFEVIVADESKCQIFKGLCRLTYDANGKLQKVSFPFSIGMVVTEVGSIEDSSHKKGYFVVGYRDPLDKNIVARHITEKGHFKQFDTDLRTHIPNLNTRVSTGYDLFTLCWLQHHPGQGRTVNCRQFDSETRESRFNVTYDYQDYVSAISVHNIRSGGFWIATLGYGLKFEDKKCILTVGKIDAEVQDWHFYTSKFEADCGVENDEIMIDIESTRNDQFCFNVLCTTKPRGYRDLSYSRKCITLEYQVKERVRRLVSE